jgi:HEAT repeat protein
LALLYVAVVGCGGAAIDRLVSELGNADPQTRLAAARELGAMSGSSTRLIEALSRASENSDAEVRAEAAEALGKKGVATKQVFPALRKALGDSAADVRLKAALAISAIEPADQSCRRVLLESLQAGDGPVFLEIGRIGSRADWAVATLVVKLSDRRPSIRALAARTLGEIGVSGKEVETALQRAQHDQTPSVRNAATESLRRLEELAAGGHSDR